MVPTPGQGDPPPRPPPPSWRSEAWAAASPGRGVAGHGIAGLSGWAGWRSNCLAAAVAPQGPRAGTVRQPSTRGTCSLAPQHSVWHGSGEATLTSLHPHKLHRWVHDGCQSQTSLGPKCLWSDSDPGYIITTVMFHWINNSRTVLS